MNTDTVLNVSFNGNITVLNSGNANLGVGDISLRGTLFSDTFSSNTIGGATTHSSRSLFTNGTASTSQTTGAVTITGGLGVGGNLYAGNIYSNGVLLTSGGGGSVTAGTNISVVGSTVSVVNNPTFSGAVTITNTTNIGNLITGLTGALNVTGDIVTPGMVAFPIGTYLSPSTITRSAGTRIVLYPDVSASNCDYAIGVETDTVWYSAGSGIGGHKFYNANGPISLFYNNGLYIYKTDNPTGKVGLGGSVQSVGGAAFAKDVYASNFYSDSGKLGNQPRYDAIINTYGTSTNAIGTSFTDITIDQFLTCDASGVLNSLTDVDVQIAEVGTYLVMAKVTLTKTVGTGTTTCTVKMVEDLTGTNVFTDVPNAFGYVVCNSTANAVSDTAYIFYTKIYGPNDRIKMVAAKTAGTTTDTITQRFLGVSLKLVRFNSNNLLDTTAYYNAFSTSNTVLNGTLTDIPFPSNRATNANYTYSAPNTTLFSGGIYLIFVSVNVTKSSGTDNSLALFQLYKNSTAVPTAGYIPVLNTTNGFGNTGFYTILNATVGDTIRLRGQLVSGTNLSCSAGTNINIIKIQNSATAQADSSYIFCTSTSNTLLNTSVTDLPFQTEVVKIGTAFTHSTSTLTNEITINEDGYYHLFGNMVYSNSAAAIGNAQILSLYNNSVSYNMFEGSYSEGFVNVSGPTNLQNVFTSESIYLPINFKIKLQGLRISSGGVLTTVGTNCSFGIIKANTTPQISKLSNVYGTQLISFSHNYSTTTTSTSFVPKGLFPTGTIPTGWYRLDWQYKIATANATAICETQITLANGITTTQVMLHRPAAQVVATNIPLYSGFLIIPLITSNYSIEFDYRVVSGTNAIIRELQMVFYRVQ